MAIPDVAELLKMWESDGTIGSHFMLLPALRRLQAETLDGAAKIGSNNGWPVGWLKIEAARIKDGR